MDQPLHKILPRGVAHIANSRLFLEELFTSNPSSVRIHASKQCPLKPDPTAAQGSDVVGDTPACDGTGSQPLGKARALPPAPMAGDGDAGELVRAVTVMLDLVS